MIDWLIDFVVLLVSITLVGLVVISLTSTDTQTVTEQLQECQIRLELYEGINEELIRRVK